MPTHVSDQCLLLERLLVCFLHIQNQSVTHMVLRHCYAMYQVQTIRVPSLNHIFCILLQPCLSMVCVTQSLVHQEAPKNCQLSLFLKKTIGARHNFYNSIVVMGIPIFSLVICPMDACP